MAFRRSRCLLSVLYPSPSSVNAHSLRKRLARLGTLDEVQKVFADTCCEGKEDVRAHIVVDLFPNVTRAPFADSFHKCQIICSHTLCSHLLHAMLARSVPLSSSNPSLFSTVFVQLASQSS